MAQNHTDASDGVSATTMDGNGQMQQSLWRRLFSGWERDNGSSGLSDATYKGQSAEQQDDARTGLVRRVSRKVVPGLPRAQTFKRQRSEMRSKLEPVRPTPAERRAVSMDRRMPVPNSSSFHHSNPRTSAPDFLDSAFSTALSSPSPPISPVGGMSGNFGSLNRFERDGELADYYLTHEADALSRVDVQSVTTSQYDAMIDDELERIWILNLSMHFRDKSKREKFFVTYREHEHLWRRVTISLDYRNAPDNSLEMELAHTKFQREKSAKIYEAIRESLRDIQFYDTVTNLKLETKDGRLHVHVVEDVNEIISYPPVRMIRHLSCRRVKEREIHFDSHMSGFVYKVRVHGRLLIKKEIPGPDTVDEFLYEINALSHLSCARNVIRFYGVVVDDRDEHVTGLLISYAERGALIDVIYDNDHSLPWPARAKWARQIVAGLSEIHEAGFVQGDFTLSNIVIDENDDAKIIDINRRGCPIGWEPPEATPLIESNQRISMYIGVKSDLYQLGMVLWALATQEDEPEAYGRPLKLEPDVPVPAWYRRIVETCLSANPRNRAHASQLLSWFPDPDEDGYYDRPNGYNTVLENDDGSARHEFTHEGITANRIPRIKTAHSPSDWACVGWGNTHVGSMMPDEPYYYPTRGRSPPSPMPSNQGDYGTSRYGHRMHAWSDTYNHAPAVPSVGGDIPPAGLRADSEVRPLGSGESLGRYSDSHYRDSGPGTRVRRDGELLAEKNGRVNRPSVLPNDVDPEVRRRSPTADDDIPNLAPVNGGKGGPESQADSGKDVTERASTPREARADLSLNSMGFSGSKVRSVSRRETTSSSAESSPRRNGAVRAAGASKITTTAESGHGRDDDDDDDDGSHDLGKDQDRQRNEREHDRLGHLSYPPSSSSGLSPRAGLGQPDDLKGIGSALDAGDGYGDHDGRRRQSEMGLDDDIELGAGAESLMLAAVGRG
ncbi:hypothetical protein VTK56DRAFT_6392 [Thermocarpiscus australiensis]